MLPLRSELKRLHVTAIGSIGRMGRRAMAKVGGRVGFEHRHRLRLRFDAVMRSSSPTAVRQVVRLPLATRFSGAARAQITAQTDSPGIFATPDLLSESHTGWASLHFV
jgi:hypothetical protein